MLNISRVTLAGHNPAAADTGSDDGYLLAGILPGYSDYEIVYCVAEDTFSYQSTCSAEFAGGVGWKSAEEWESTETYTYITAQMDSENFADLDNYVLEEYATGNPPARYMKFGGLDGYGWGTHGGGFAVTKESGTFISETWTFEEQAEIDPATNGLPGYWILDQDVTGENRITAFETWEEYFEETWPQNENILSTQACTGALNRGYGWAFFPWQFWRVIQETDPIYQYDAYGNRVQEYVCLGRDPSTGVCVYGEYRDKIIGYTITYTPACASLCEEAAGACEDPDEGKK